MRVLLVEPGSEENERLEKALLEKNYQVDISQSFDDARYLIDIRNYDLILLDWPLSMSNVTDLINEAKKKSSKSSVIIISERQDRLSEIEALKGGADDYVRKPLDLELLMVRIEAKLRFGASNIIEIEELIINPEEEKIIYQGREIELKGKPFEVLTHLARHKDHIVSKEQLLDAIWEEPELVTPNVIEVAINQIRQKMDKPLGITTIETVRRRGYRFCFPKKPADAQ